MIDFAYRAFHVTTVTAKSIATTFYGRKPSYSYWNGCSGGGSQGLMEAWRYPYDFDGIIAGAPGSAFNVDALFWWTSVAQAAHRTPDAWIPQSKLPVIHQAALQACDAVDGITDGVIQDPTRCGFDPVVLKCKAADGAGCLTDAQVATARQIYSPVTDPVTKKKFFAGLRPGSELGWAAQAGEAPYGLATEPLKYLFFKDPQWDYRTLDLGSRVSTAHMVAPDLDSLHQPDLRPFFKSNGKLLLYHGWNDQALPPESSVQYYKSVVQAAGKASTDSLRLFMIPGMAHCGGGEGPNDFDALGALTAWVENGKAPDSMIARHVTGGTVDRTRPVCSYPQVAVYMGSGGTDEAANFSCRVPARN
jgi:feruloyl esterase